MPAPCLEHFQDPGRMGPRVKLASEVAPAECTPSQACSSVPRLRHEGSVSSSPLRVVCSNRYLFTVQVCTIYFDCTRCACLRSFCAPSDKRDNNGSQRPHRRVFVWARVDPNQRECGNTHGFSLHFPLSSGSLIDMAWTYSSAQPELCAVSAVWYSKSLNLDPAA